MLVAVSEVCNASLVHTAADEAVKDNGGNRDITECFGDLARGATLH